MTEHEFQVYDLVRRICEADHEAHQVDVAALAAKEGVVDEQTNLFNIVDIMRPVLKKLVWTGYLKHRHRPFTAASYQVARDLLTVMAERL